MVHIYYISISDDTVDGPMSFSFPVMSDFDFSAVKHDLRDATV